MGIPLMDQLYGISLYVISLLTFGGIYAAGTFGFNFTEIKPD